LSLALHKKELKLVEDLEERVIVALKEVSGVSLVDAPKVQDVFLDLLNTIKTLKEAFLDE
jgi:hypothetical protein